MGEKITRFSDAQCHGPTSVCHVVVMVAKKSTPKINQTTATIQNYGTAVMIN